MANIADCDGPSEPQTEFVDRWFDGPTTWRLAEALSAEYALLFLPVAHHSIGEAKMAKRQVIDWLPYALAVNDMDAELLHREYGVIARFKLRHWPDDECLRALACRGEIQQRGEIRTVFLYDDGCNPASGDGDWRAYCGRLKKLSQLATHWKADSLREWSDKDYGPFREPPPRPDPRTALDEQMGAVFTWLNRQKDGRDDPVGDLVADVKSEYLNGVDAWYEFQRQAWSGAWSALFKAVELYCAETDAKVDMTELQETYGD